MNGFVGVVRLELTTTCTPCKYASQLRHTPIFLTDAKLGKNLIGKQTFNIYPDRQEPPQALIRGIWHSLSQLKAEHQAFQNPVCLV